MIATSRDVSDRLGCVECGYEFDVGDHYFERSQTQEWLLDGADVAAPIVEIVCIIHADKVALTTKEEQ